LWLNLDMGFHTKHLFVCLFVFSSVLAKFVTSNHCWSSTCQMDKLNVNLSNYLVQKSVVFSIDLKYIYISSDLLKKTILSWNCNYSSSSFLRFFLWMNVILISIFGNMLYGGNQTLNKKRPYLL
jgi:hypothetical protein